MKIRNLFLAPVLISLAVAFLGCSADNAVTPNADSGSSGSADKTVSTLLCHIYGNVYDFNGDYAVGVQVRIEVIGAYLPVYVTTGQYGSFSWDTYLWEGCRVSCASLGDTQVRLWPGGAYMYFGLTQQPGEHHDDISMIEP